MLKWIKILLESEMAATLSCRHFTQLTAFSLGYGGQTPSIHVIERLLHSEGQMSISDIHILSKGVDCYEFNTGWSRTPIALQALSELSLLLDRRIVHWLGESTMLSKTTTLLTASRHGQRYTLGSRLTIQQSEYVLWASNVVGTMHIDQLWT